MSDLMAAFERGYAKAMGFDEDACPRCGKVLQHGEYPFCGGKNAHGFGTLKVIGDDIPGGMVLHNLGHAPVRVDSHSQRKRIAESRGLSNAVCHVDGDRHVGRMV